MTDLDEAARMVIERRAREGRLGPRHGLGDSEHGPAAVQQAIRRRWPQLSLIDVYRRVSELQHGVL